MRKLFIIFKLSIYNIIFFTSCQKEFIEIKPMSINEISINKFYEFENGDKWFGSGLNTFFYINNKDTLIFNDFFNFSKGNNFTINSQDIAIYSYSTGKYLGCENYYGENYYFIFDFAAYKNRNFTFKYVSELNHCNYLYFDKNLNTSIFYKEENNNIILYYYDGHTTTKKTTNIPSLASGNPIISDNNQGIWTLFWNINILPLQNGYYLEHYNSNGDLDKRIKTNKKASNIIIDQNGDIWGISDGNIWKLRNDSIITRNSLNLNLPTGSYTSIQTNNNNLFLKLGSYHYRYNILNDTLIKLENIDDKPLMGDTYQGVYIVQNGIVSEIINDKLVYRFGKKE